MQKEYQMALLAQSFASELHQETQRTLWTTAVMVTSHYLLYSHFMNYYSMPKYQVLQKVELDIKSWIFPCLVCSNCVVKVSLFIVHKLFIGKKLLLVYKQFREICCKREHFLWYERVYLYMYCVTYSSIYLW